MNIMGRGGGGGGRSGGGGGGRSGSGHSSFSSHSRGGGRNSNSGGSFNSLGGLSNLRNLASIGRSFGGGGYRSSYGGGGMRGMGGFFIPLIVLIVIYLFTQGLGSSSKVQESTIKREKLTNKASYQTELYQDNLNWITSSDKLEKDLNYFYKKTGVFPFVYIDDSTDGKSSAKNSDMKAFSEGLYDTLFKDEGHMLLIWIEDSDGYQSYIVSGSAASTVIDPEAREILLDLLDRNYNKDYDDEEFFGTSFREAADKMMAAPAMKTSTKIIVGVVVIVIGFGIIFMVISIFRNRRREAEADAAILNADVNPIDDDPALNSRANKYK